MRVTDYKKIGQTTKGAPIYAVTAVHEDGSPVEKDGKPIELRAFQELPVGEIVEYALKLYVHPTYGDTYTLYPPKEKLGRRVDALEKLVAELQQRVADLESGSVGGAIDMSPDDDIPF